MPSDSLRPVVSSITLSLASVASKCTVAVLRCFTVTVKVFSSLSPGSMPEAVMAA